MDRKYLPLAGTLAVAAAGVVGLSLWGALQKDAPTPDQQKLCFGSLSARTASLLDDGEGGRVSDSIFERGGEGAYAVFRSCHVRRDDPGGESRRGVYFLVVEDRRTPVGGPPKGAVPLADGRRGWVGPETGEALLPASCARRLGSTAPHIVVSLRFPEPLPARRHPDRKAGIPAMTRVLEEVADNLPVIYGCADPKGGAGASPGG